MRISESAIESYVNRLIESAAFSLTERGKSRKKKQAQNAKRNMALKGKRSGPVEYWRTTDQGNRLGFNKHGIVVRPKAAARNIYRRMDRG